MTPQTQGPPGLGLLLVLTVVKGRGEVHGHQFALFLSLLAHKSDPHLASPERKASSSLDKELALVSVIVYV